MAVQPSQSHLVVQNPAKRLLKMYCNYQKLQKKNWAVAHSMQQHPYTNGTWLSVIYN